MPRTVRVPREDMTLDLLIWEELGNTEQLKETIALNPGLPELGPILPLMHPVVLPDPKPADAVPIRETVRLWTV